MNVAVLSESPADEAAIRILVEAIMGQQTEGLPLHLRHRGVDSVFAVLPAVVKHLHYRTSADALVVVVDSNHTPLHDDECDEDLPIPKRCRLWRLRQTVQSVTQYLRPVLGRTAMKFAMGLAVPAIEAWYLCGKDPKVSERAWEQGLAAKKLPYDSKALKRQVYGTDRPLRPEATRRAREEAQRLASCLDLLESEFPIGFGSFLRGVQSW